MKSVFAESFFTLKQLLNIHILVFAFLMVAPVYLEPGIVYSVELSYLILFIAYTKTLYKRIVIIALIPVLMILVGIIGLLSNPVYPALKDAWYFTNIFVPIIVGCTVAMRVDFIKTLVPVILLCSFAMSIGHIVNFLVLKPEEWNAIQEFKKQHGTEIFISVMGISILLVSKYYKIVILRNKYYEYIALAVFATAILLSYSRSNIGGVVLLVILSTFNFRKPLNIAALVIVMSIVVGSIISWNESSGIDRESFEGKIMFTVEEVYPQDIYFHSDIIRRWRGYETYQAVKTYLEGNTFNLIFGHGFGKMIDIEKLVTLGGYQSRHIPILHNGYAYTLVKTGLTGFLLYIAYLVAFMFSGYRALAAKKPAMTLTGRLVISLGVFYLFSTYVISGLFSKSMLICSMVILGSMIAYIDRHYLRPDASVSEPTGKTD